MKTQVQFILLFLLLWAFCISCTRHLAKLTPVPSNISENSNFRAIENIVREAFQVYHQGQLGEAVLKLEDATSKITKYTPKSTVTTLFTFLAFFQQKSGDYDKATATFKSVKDFFQELKTMPNESEALANKLIQFSSQLNGHDRLQLLERLHPIASASHGKAGEAGIIWQISEAYLAINNYQEAYERGKEALKLAQDSGALGIEVRASIAISRSLIGLGRFQEVEVPLQEVLPKTEKNLSLKAIVLGARGMVYHAQGRTDLALQDFREGIFLARSFGETNLMAQLQSGLGNIYLSNGNPREAIQELLEALSHFESINDELNVAKTEGMIAQAYLEISVFGEANRHAMRASDLQNKLGNRIEESKNLRTIGQSLAGLNKVDEALEILKKAVDIQVEERDRNEALKTFILINKLLKQMGRIEDLKRSLLAGLDANAAFFGDKKAEAYIRSELGDVYKELGSFYNALVEYMKASELYYQLSNKKSLIVTLLNQASVLAYLDDQDKRIELLTVAEQIAADLNDPEVQVLILNDFAEVFRDLGSTVEAFEKYLEAVKVSQQINKKSQIFSLISISDFCMDWMGEYNRALDYLNEALILAKEIGDRESESNILLGIGKTYLRIGRFEDAVRLSHDALAIIRSTKAEKLMYETLALEYLGLALINQGLYDSAFEVYQEWLQVAMQSGSASQIQRAYTGLGYISLKMGKYVEAVEGYKKAITWTEGLRSGIIGEKHKISFFEEQLSPYEGIIEALYHLYVSRGSEKKRFAEEALHFAELSKARSWADHLSMARLRFIEETISQEVRKKEEDAFKQFLAAREAYTSASSRYRIPDEELQREEKAWELAQKKWKVFVEELYKKYPQYVTFRYPLTRRRYPEDSFRKMEIREGETVIIYKLTPDWTYAWVIKKIEGNNKIIKFTRLATKTSDIKNLVEKFLIPFRKVKYEQFAPRVSSELYKAILQPVLEGMDISKRIVIVPDGILSIVPFEALVTELREGDQGKKLGFLCDKFDIGYYPSVAILTINRQTVPKDLPMKSTVLAIGDPVYGPDDERLVPSQVSLLRESEQRQGLDIPTRRGRIRKEAQDQGYTFERIKYSGVEVLKINDLFRDIRGHCDVLIGFEASKERMKSKDLAKYQYLHFAVHGILSYEVPYLKEPALVLAVDPESKDDGFLTFSEIYGLKLNADLVTLSACKTGLGQRVAGEGVIGISRAFMNAGARAVVVSLWEVSDQSTALLMEEFYRFLANGLDKVEALKMAKEYLRKKGYENPYFWAPFILVGD